MTIDGYYHIFKNERDANLDDFEETRRVTQGQIKITIQVNKPLYCELNLLDTEKREQEIILRNMLNKPVPIHEDTHRYKEETKMPERDTEENALQKAVRMAKELREKTRDQTVKETAERLGRIPYSAERDFKDVENEDQNVHSSLNELKVRNNQNLKDLDTITAKLKDTYGDLRDDPFEEIIEENEDDLARASHQNFESSLE